MSRYKTATQAPAPTSDVYRSEGLSFFPNAVSTVQCMTSATSPSSPLIMAPQSPSADAEKVNHMIGVSLTTDGSTPSTPTLADNTESTPKNGYMTKLKALFSGWYYLGEVVGIIISAASILSICVVVGYFNGKPPPKWFLPFYIPINGGIRPQLTLNSLLAMLSVIGSTCAMIPVSKGLGQLKYIWFIQQDRQLADLEMFDSASRSKLGSAQLIWKLRLK